MKKLTVIFLLFMYVINVKSQNNNELVFTKQLNRLVSAKTNITPKLYRVNTNKYKAVTNTTSRNLTNEYKSILEQVNLAVRDSIKAVKNKKSLNVKLHALEEITVYINNYLNLKGSYELKKDELKDAQMVSDEYNLEYLLYADDETNSENEHKFIALTAKKSDMKSYLKSILDNIDKRQQRISLGKDDKLKQLRKQLNNTQQYEIVQNKANVLSYDSYTLSEYVINPENEITGQFENLGYYYVLRNKEKGFQADQLVSAKEVRQMKINKDNFIFKNSAVLIKHKTTKKTYLARADFINQYAINKLASQAKFNGRTSFANKVYKSKEDKIYDALIMNYSKSQITAMDGF